MNRFISDTVVGRTLIVLILGLALSHAISMAFYVTDRSTALSLQGREHIAERIVTLTHLIDNAPPEDRDLLARLANSEALHVSRSQSAFVMKTSQAGWKTDVVRRSFANHMERIGQRHFLLSYEEDKPPTDAPGGDAAFWKKSNAEKRLLVSVKLSDGSWLNFRANVESSESLWSLRFILSSSVMIIAVVALSIFIVNRWIQPLRVFAGAARNLGRDIKSPSLPVAGPREVRDAIEAFNEMQQRIRRLIEDRTQMLTAISHDLRTPVTLLRLRAEFIEDDEERAKMLATLDDMEAMISSVLAFAREDAEKEPSETVDLAALVESVCDDMADAGLPVEFTGSERLPYECRRMAIRRTVTNLIDNAVKYGKRARVHLGVTPEAVTITVDDEGPGIPDAELERVFSPFYRLESSRGSDTGGTGLGLSVARAMVLANGGELTLENRPDGGLRATIRLPR